jgi:16S rRNA (guanine(527)-N(7))-methyltransferase RsmG
MTFGDALIRRCGDCVLSELQMDQLESHYELLKRWNRSLNLTRITSTSEAVDLHYCESLFLSRVLPAGTLRIADVGSGGGFPGLPLAVARPECDVWLIESHQRKIVFLREAVRSIGNAVVFPDRAERVGSRFDWVVARAIHPRHILSLNLSPNAAILTTSAALSSLPTPNRVFAIPSTSDRVVAMFHVEREAC